MRSEVHLVDQFLPVPGQLQGLGIALFVLVVILALIRWGNGFIANVAVLLGIVAGAALASLIGIMQYDRLVMGRRRDAVALRYPPI